MNRVPYAVPITVIAVFFAGLACAISMGARPEDERPKPTTTQVEHPRAGTTQPETRKP
jgi:hypothetical protein